MTIVIGISESLQRKRAKKRKINRPLRAEELRGSQIFSTKPEDRSNPVQDNSPDTIHATVAEVQ